MSELNKAPKGGSEAQGSGGKKKAGGLMSGLVAVLAALLLVAVVFAGVFTFVLKQDMFGLGERFRADFQKNPILRLALPAAPDTFDVDAPENLTQEELLKKYEEFRQKAASLQVELDAARLTISAIEAQNLSKSAVEMSLTATEAAITAELADLARQKAELEALSLSIGSMAANGDTASFKQYFENLDPETAADIYARILGGEALAAQAKLAARPFELMDRKKAALVMKELWSKDKELLISIAAANKPQTLAEILANMDAVLAADITKSLADFRKAEAEAKTAANEANTAIP